MSFQFTNLLMDIAGVTAGAVIGLAFGLLQQAALRRNEARQREGKLKSGWSLMPGAGVRTAYLLIALALVQLVCPLLFVDGTQWLVSGGVVLGYGWMLLQQLRAKLKAGVTT
ncbi:MAG: hypothetical protein JSS11_12250 [Verrucomicrobia bacterium]|nr:hypothetical protein [Verrucomicrobiota bacterium]